MEQLDVIVVGAGIGGLGSALALSRAGHRVTMVERDDTPMPPDPESAFDWDRRGAPQVRHPHVFLGLARTILRDRFPDVLDRLTALGIEPPTPSSMGGGAFQLDEETIELLASDDDLRMLPVRRTTFEWVMRSVVLEEPNVTFRVGVGVAGVECKEVSDGPPVVTGVRLEDDSVLSADLVVATSGRRGDVPAWLAVHGIEIDETVNDAGVVYFSRFYRADGDYEFGFRAAFGAGIGVGCIGSDAGTYSITAFVDKKDKELRSHLNDNARFEATMALLPEIADVVEAQGEPIHPVHCMTGLINRIRTFTDSAGTPLVSGFVAVGDAHTCTNPAYGRGMSLALKQAVMLTDEVASHDEMLAAARAYEQRSIDEVVPWYHFSVLTDQMRSSAAAAGGNVSRGAGDPFATLFNSEGVEPEVIRLVMRVMNLLEMPTALMTVLSTLQSTPAAEPKRPAAPKVKRPKRADLLAVGA